MSIEIDGVDVVGGKTVEVWGGIAEVKDVDGRLLATFQGFSKIEVTPGE